MPKNAKEIPDFPGYYATPGGEIWSERRKKRFLRPAIDKDGYLYVVLYRNKKRRSKRVHVLVLETFVELRPKGAEGCHNNGVRNDNWVGNLRWDTRINNERDKTKHGTDNKGERHGRAKLNRLQVRIIRYLCNFPEEFIQREIAELFDITRYTVSNIKNRHTWKGI